MIIQKKKLSKRTAFIILFSTCAGINRAGFNDRTWVNRCSGFVDRTWSWDSNGFLSDRLRVFGIARIWFSGVWILGVASVGSTAVVVVGVHW